VFVISLCQDCCRVNTCDYSFLKSSIVAVNLKRLCFNISLLFCIVNSKCDITRLKIDAIVNPTNEALNSTHGVSVDILEKAGPG
jgi:hypothetical protein